MKLERACQLVSILGRNTAGNQPRARKAKTEQERRTGSRVEKTSRASNAKRLCDAGREPPNDSQNSRQLKGAAGRTAARHA